MNTCRKVPLQVSFFRFGIAFYQSNLCTGSTILTYNGAAYILANRTELWKNPSFLTGEEANRATARKPGPLQVIQYTLGAVYRSSPLSAILPL